MIALTVLFIVLVAVVGLLVTGIKVINSYSDKEVGQSVATGILDQDQVAAAASFPPAGLPNSVSSTAQWCPTAGCTPLTATEGNNVTYYAYVTGGWCVYSGSTKGGSWTTGSATTTSPEATYFVAVKVAWGAAGHPTTGGATTSAQVTAISTLSSVVMFSALATPIGYQSLPTSGTVNECPVGLT